MNTFSENNLKENSVNTNNVVFDDKTLTSRKPKTTSADVFIGNMIKQFRKICDLTQTTMAEACGITFQQLQKYEKGSNRVTVVMLLKIVNVLNQKFISLNDNIINILPSRMTRLTISDLIPKTIDIDQSGKIVMKNKDDIPSTENFYSFLNDEQIIVLIKAYYAIQNPKLRDSAIRFICALANSEEELNDKKNQ